MAPVEDTTKPKRCPNFSDGELFAMVSMVSDNKILLLGKLDNVNTARRKAMGWNLVYYAVNNVSVTRRSRQEVRKKFTEFRANVKKKAASERKHTSRTGNCCYVKFYGLTLIPSCEPSLCTYGVRGLMIDPVWNNNLILNYANFLNTLSLFILSLVVTRVNYPLFDH